jgi:transcriptional regulator with XRE-family HTH domain
MFHNILSRAPLEGHKLEMITAAQMRAARALLGADQRKLAELSGLSVPTIQRMEASEGVVRGNVDSLMKLIDALNSAGIELIGEGGVSRGGGRGVRLKSIAGGQPAGESGSGSPPRDA